MTLRKVALTAAVIATTLTPTMTLAQRGHWGGHGGWHGGGWGHHGGWGWGNGWGWGLAGLAAGTLIGGALAARPYGGYGYGYGYAPGYAAYGYGYAPGAGSVAYCEQRYRSYDPASGTYLGYDGVRHPCP
jgi:hypothetical protein